MREDRWAALFSGGKDSYLAVALARERGLRVDELVTVDAEPGSYLYHAPATAATGAIADSLGLTHTQLSLAGSAVGHTDSETAARAEVEPVRTWLADAVEDGVIGLVSGVVASRYQFDLLEELADRFDIDLVTPLWGRSGADVLELMHEHALTVDIVAVAAEGLDRTWLGRRLDRVATDELRALASSHAIHPAGEGGEFETLVVDAPAFRAPIRYEARPIWRGTHGHLRLTSVAVAERTATDRST